MERRETSERQSADVTMMNLLTPYAKKLLDEQTLNNVNKIKEKASSNKHRNNKNLSQTRQTETYDTINTGC